MPTTRTDLRVGDRIIVFIPSLYNHRPGIIVSLKTRRPHAIRIVLDGQTTRRTLHERFIRRPL